MTEYRAAAGRWQTAGTPVGIMHRASRGNRGHVELVGWVSPGETQRSRATALGFQPSLLAVCSGQPMTQAQIALAEAMAESTLSPLAAVVGLFLPAGLSQQVDTIYDLRIPDYASQKSTIESRLIKLLQERGPLRGRQIDTHFRKVDWRKSAGYLVRRGVLASQSVLPPARVRPKFIKTAQLAASPEIAGTAMDDLGKTESTRTRRKKAMRFLTQVKDAINVSWVYAESGCNLADLQELEERGLIRLFES